MISHDADMRLALDSHGEFGGRDIGRRGARLVYLQTLKPGLRVEAEYLEIYIE